MHSSPRSHSRFKSHRPGHAANLRSAWLNGKPSSSLPANKRTIRKTQRIRAKRKNKKNVKDINVLQGCLKVLRIAVMTRVSIATRVLVMMTKVELKLKVKTSEGESLRMLRRKTTARHRRDRVTLLFETS